MENWSLVEIAWTAIAIIGVHFSAKNIRDGRADLKALRLVQDGTVQWRVLHIAAFGNIRRDIFRFIIQFGFMIIGLLAGGIPASDSITPIGFAFQAILLGGSLFLTISAILDSRDRTRLIKLGKVLEAQEHGLL